MSETDPSDLTRDALEREVEKLRDKVRALKDETERLADELLDAQNDNDGRVEDAESQTGALHEAIAALHEQAHGPVSARFCPFEPCHSLELTYVGPAPLTLVEI